MNETVKCFVFCLNMTVERTRQLLKDKVKDLTDDQVILLIQEYSQLADTLLEQLPTLQDKYDTICPT